VIAVIGGLATGATAAAGGGSGPRGPISAAWGAYLLSNTNGPSWSSARAPPAARVRGPRTARAQPRRRFLSQASPVLSTRVDERRSSLTAARHRARLAQNRPIAARTPRAWRASWHHERRTTSKPCHRFPGSRVRGCASDCSRAHSQPSSLRCAGQSCAAGCGVSGPARPARRSDVEVQISWLKHQGRRAPAGAPGGSRGTVGPDNTADGAGPTGNLERIDPKFERWRVASVRAHRVHTPAPDARCAPSLGR